MNLYRIIVGLIFCMSNIGYAELQTKSAFYVGLISTYNSTLALLLADQQQLTHTVRAETIEHALSSLEHALKAYEELNEILSTIKNNFEELQRQGIITARINNELAAQFCINNLNGWIILQQQLLAQKRQELRDAQNNLLQQQAVSLGHFVKNDVQKGVKRIASLITHELQKKEEELALSFANLKQALALVQEEKRENKAAKKMLNHVSVRLQDTEDKITELQRAITDLERENQRLLEVRSAHHNEQEEGIEEVGSGT